MIMRLLAIAALGTTLIAGLALADEPKPAAPNDEHDFGAKVVVVVTHPQAAQALPGGGYLENAKVRKIGDRSFVVGKAADLGTFSMQPKGTTVWFPLSEVMQMTEYDSVDALRKALVEQAERVREGK
jgi:hypothetical protein